MARTIKGILFDLDGTLVDHDTAAASAFTAALKAVAGSAEVDHEAARRRWSELEHHAMDRYLAGELTFTGQRRLRITTLAAEFGLGSWQEREADAWFAGYLRHYESAWRVFPDVMASLDALVDGRPWLRLGILTNGEAAQQRDKVRRVGLDTALPVLIASSDIGVAKPAPESFHAACETIRLRPSEVAYVGDRLDTDATAARAAGLYGVWLNRGGGPARTDLPVVRSLGELPALLTSPA
ncbi:HAD family hydrolase [Streptosporangium carneum]|uniref:Hydrolase n=1 Tax=Streptosporangium carneum TaxID=47481 RepID=A0A9W6I4D7_9ACTN|nr:HAD family hydrolase [Streptosporangium carneum]GLK11467.1 hydrolase [Streptosporangium carneum]